MPRRLLACAVFVPLLVGSATLASAAPEATKADTSRRGETTPSESRAAGNNTTVPAENPDTLDTRIGTREGTRIWSVSAGVETHVAFVQSEPDDLRARPGKFYDYFFLGPQIFVDPYDLFRVDAALYQYFTADPGETGLRFADVAATYTRYIPILTGGGDRLPSQAPSQGVLLRVALSATAPTSYLSQLHGVITVPRARLYLQRTFLHDSLLLGANGFGEYYIDRYRTAQGGSDNAITRYTAQISADYTFPFAQRFSVGALAASTWTYYYEPDVTILPYPGGVSSYPHQTPQQDYSAEVGLRYAAPPWKGIATLVALTYSLGDDTVLHDGVQHLYFTYFRRTSEMYATLTARY